mmetsp:Transcript_35755/g.54756  ORF Transcript_35755/g.54756 Transcript_35755/m.54756 type:complete len:81 (+) Transcript_35755:1112-1354(+)
MFAAVVFLFFFSGRYCDRYNATKRRIESEGNDPQALEDLKDSHMMSYFCENSTTWTMNIGVTFLVMAVIRGYGKKFFGMK